ncbi:YqjF family protein [Salinithrix halophila]|uniref:YqjF family protein n=1 Tax=Salinithrix halophila TaxID=1485204 RepID=A0ABV8JKL3_9BACL
MLNQTSHRPWKLPKKPWVMSQTWGKALFSHWPVSVDQIRDLVPPILEIDTFDNQAWISVVPFEMSDIQLRLLPAFPLANLFPELNVRTYVIYQGKPGVFFFSCDAANPLAVVFARSIYHLPYLNARMCLAQKEEEIEFKSKRTHRNTPKAEFHCLYKPVSDVFFAQKDSLDYWLMERYCLYTTYHKKLFRTNIHHLPWPLQHAEAEFIHNTMVDPWRISIPKNQRPLLHYANSINVLAWQHFCVIGN